MNMIQLDDVMMHRKVTHKKIGKGFSNEEIK
jgi:hypothetical protein